MLKPGLKDWIFAVRPWSFPASSMPALIAFAYVFFISSRGELPVHWFLGIIAVAGAVIFHASGNLISDYFDYTRGVDREDTLGAGMLVNKVFKPKTILYYGFSLLLIGCLFGLFLFWKTGYPLLFIGGIGLIGTLFYYQFKSNALGDFLIFVIYGPVICLGTYYTMTLRLDWEAVVLCFPVAFVTVDILHANNTRDILHDKRANIKTVAICLGLKKSILLYKVYLILAYLSLVLLVVSGVVSWLNLIVFLTLPIALRNIRIMDRAKLNEPQTISDLDVKTAQLQLIYSLLMIISLIISSWF